MNLSKGMQSFLFAFRLMRAGAFFALALMMLFTAVALLAQPDPVTTEHRITTLETKMDEVVEQIADLKQYLLYGMAGTAGLCGEAGIRLVRRKPPAE